MMRRVLPLHGVAHVCDIWQLHLTRNDRAMFGRPAGGWLLRVVEFMRDELPDVSADLTFSPVPCVGDVTLSLLPSARDIVPCNMADLYPLADWSVLEPSLLLAD